MVELTHHDFSLIKLLRDSCFRLAMLWCLALTAIRDSLGLASVLCGAFVFLDLSLCSRIPR